VLLLASQDGGALIRVIAGEVAGHRGPGVTWTPIDYLHVSIHPGAQLRLPWRADFNALAYALVGQGSVGREGVPLRDGELAVFGPGEALTLTAHHPNREYSPYWEVLLLGGLPIREPIVQWGPFVMNTREEIVQAIEDYQAGRMGTIPASVLAARQEEDGS
jgi:redox-sensitive bicupin YhaK (pirin superfamily)